MKGGQSLGPSSSPFLSSLDPGNSEAKSRMVACSPEMYAPMEAQGKPSVFWVTRWAWITPFSSSEISAQTCRLECLLAPGAWAASGASPTDRTPLCQAWPGVEGNGCASPTRTCSREWAWSWKAVHLAASCRRRTDRDGAGFLDTVCGSGYGWILSVRLAWSQEVSALPTCATF